MAKDIKKEEEMRKKALISNNSSIAETLNAIANIYYTQGKFL